MIKTAADVLNFWFDPDNIPKQFAKDDAFDEAIRTQFGDTWEAARVGLLWPWRETLEGRLAEIIVLDQFSRNLKRDTREAFAQDPMAVVLAQELLNQPGFGRKLTDQQKRFAYMPFMHSESADIHKFAVQIFTELGNEESLEYELRHQYIIERFGRYPHRNQALGRISTVEELAFLKEPNSSF